MTIDRSPSKEPFPEIRLHPTRIEPAWPHCSIFCKIPVDAQDPGGGCWRIFSQHFLSHSPFHRQLPLRASRFFNPVRFHFMFLATMLKLVAMSRRVGGWRLAAFTTCLSPLTGAGKPAIRGGMPCAFVIVNHHAAISTFRARNILKMTYLLLFSETETYCQVLLDCVPIVLLISCKITKECRSFLIVTKPDIFIKIFLPNPTYSVKTSAVL